MKNGLVKYFAGRLGTYRYAGHYSPRDTTGRVVVINTLDNKKYSADVDVRLCINLDKGWDEAEALRTVIDTSELLNPYMVVLAAIMGVACWIGG